MDARMPSAASGLSASIRTVRRSVASCIACLFTWRAPSCIGKSYHWRGKMERVGQTRAIGVHPVQAGKTFQQRAEQEEAPSSSVDVNMTFHIDSLRVRACSEQIS